MKQIAIALITPAYGGVVSAEHQRMFLHIGNQLGNNIERFRLSSIGYVDVNPVDRARNRILAEAMVKSADWVFMIDADTWVVDHGEDDAGIQILQMISDADKLDAAIVFAPVRRRVGEKREHEIMAYKIDENVIHMGGGDYTGHKPARRDKHRAQHISADQLNPTMGLQEVDAGATACFAINLHFANKAQAEFKFTAELSEDLEFCRQIREAGGKIYCDARVHTAHLSRSYPLLSHAD